jgi:hypothetical protein
LEEVALAHWKNLVRLKTRIKYAIYAGEINYGKWNY